MATEDARKLFVAGLPDTISEDILRQQFEATGGAVVEVSIPRDRMTGRPRGFGFVTMATEEEALSARSALDGTSLAGKPISVRPFQAEPPRKDGPMAGGPRPPMGGGGGFAAAPDRTLYVGNLPYDCTPEEVDALISGTGAGPVARVNLPMDPDGRKRGFGFITMETADAARAAMEALRGADLRGRRLVINIAHPKGERPGPRTDGPSPSYPPRPSQGPPPGGGMRSGPPPDRGAPPFRGGGGGYGMPPPNPDPPPRRFEEKRKPRADHDADGARRRKNQERDRDRGRGGWENYDDDDDE
ncbi:MAG TPA: RNA-binding protein [Polyangiaceae bacterium]|nr:RNA-binding protein [Polyangiaceae bacterium]